MIFFKKIKNRWKEAKKNTQQERQNKKRAKALIDFAEREFFDGFYYDWEDELGKEFAAIVDQMNTDNWLYFESIIDTIPSETLYNIGYYLYVEPVFYKLNNLQAKKILCLAFIHCNHEESYQLCDEVTAELGTYVDLQLSFLEKVRERFEVILAYLEETHPENSNDWLKKCIVFLNEKIQNTQTYEQNNP